ncbi:hypothetical protein BC829DRAFT_416197 [Chytridium lagenaria]|nr:hypothetical protein BC829DRAFT_416197 [Chytridium lagenaria]
MTKLYDGRCEAKDACPSQTCDDAEDSPVCGSDGKKYKNSCSFLKMLCSYPEFPVAITPVDAYGGECKAADPVEPLPSTSSALSYVATKSTSPVPKYTKPNYLVDSGAVSVKSVAGVAAFGAFVCGLFF